MKPIFAAAFFIVFAPAIVMAGPLDIGQVKSKTPIARTPGDVNESKEEGEITLQGDHQNEVLNNPVISDYGRTAAFTHFNEQQQQGGANVAIIHQEGVANSSNVTQTGKKNVAKHIQKGESNDITLIQNGENNLSSETQEGKYNRKIKVQNGVKAKKDKENELEIN